MTGPQDSLSLTIVGATALIRFADPQSLNGIHRGNIDLFPQLVAAAEQQADVRYIVVQGDTRVFCSGGAGDFLKELGELSHGERLRQLEAGQVWIRALMQSPCLTVAAIEGLALGAGVDLALSFDVALLWPGARFSFFYNRLDAVPDLGGLWLLQELIGPRAALSFLAGTETWDCARLSGLRLGEVQEGDCPQDAESWSRLLSRRYPITRTAYGAAKAALNGPRLGALMAHQREVAEAQATIFGTDTFQDRLARVASLRRLMAQ